MHTLQWIAVEADDEETAAAEAERLLQEAMGDGENPSSWYDWFIVGGGRWNSSEDDGLMGQYQTKTNMVISYDKDPNGFRGQVDKCITNRIATYNEYHKEIKDKDVMAMFENYGGVMSYSLETYPLRNLLRFIDGDWFYDSAFYDFTTWSTNATHILSRLDKHDLVTPKVTSGMFLVPIDFHF
jgi:hypothetical protein